MDIMKPWMASVLVVMMSASLVGCSGELPPQDSNGHSPGDVVLLAYRSAISGNYDEANQYATDAFVEREQKARRRLDAGESERVLLAWPWRIQGIDSPAVVAIESEELINPTTASVMLTLRKLSRVKFQVVLQDGVWKIDR